METFERGSLTHIVTVVVCLALAALLVRRGRRLAAADPAGERRMRRFWALFVLAFQLLTQIVQNLPGLHDARVTLPLHVCDLAGLLAPVALLAPWRLPRTLLVFWGLGLNVFAFLMPIVREGPAAPWFWMFWIGHAQILASALYLPFVLGVRPGPRDAGAAFAITGAYAAAVTPVNLVLGSDYGAIGPERSATAFLGPWPARAALLLALEGVLFALMIPALRIAGGGPRQSRGPKSAA